MSARAITPAPPPGIYPGAPMADYHKWDAASNSRLSRLKKSAAHLLAYLLEPERDDSPAKITGRALHSAVLEPDLFTATYAVAGQCAARKKGDGERCTNAGIFEIEGGAWACGVKGHAEQLGHIALNGRAVLSALDYATCLGVRDAINAHPEARGLLYAPGRTVELAMTWKDEQTGATCKSRPDVFSPALADGAIVDVKSCGDASEEGFMLSTWKFGYYRQAALYLEGAAANGQPCGNFVFVAVEKEPPYALQVFRLTEGSIDAGAQELRGLLERYQRCVDTGTFPGYPTGIRDLALPDFAWAKLDRTLSPDTP